MAGSSFRNPLSKYRVETASWFTGLIPQATFAGLFERIELIEHLALPVC